MTFDILIKNGRIIDGAGNPGFMQILRQRTTNKRKTFQAKLSGVHRKNQRIQYTG